MNRKSTTRATFTSARQAGVGSWDDVVVGAGTAGSVVVRRLVDAGRRVLVLEAGGWDEHPAIHDPARLLELWESTVDWGYWTEPQPECVGRRMYWPRGKVVGGCSSMNGMIYVRGCAADYDHWAYQGCYGWDWSSVLPYFRRAEGHPVDPGAPDESRGPLPVVRNVDPSPLAVAFLRAAQQWGLPLVDAGRGTACEGVSLTRRMMRAGRRASAWASYVAPVVGHPNLTVVTNVVVHHLVVERDRVVGVGYSADGQFHRAYAEDEVVVCAGVIGSPQLLLLSGIGPAAHLARLGVAVRLDLPGVGENLHDHLVVPLVWAARQPIPPSGQGLEAHLYWRSHPGLAVPDTQPVLMGFPFPPPGWPRPEQGFTVMAGLDRPRSRGRLWLRSPDPDEPPALDPRIYTEPHDLEVMVDSVTMVREIVGQPAMHAWRGQEITPGPRVRDRARVREFVRAATLSYHHQVGTCRMGIDNLAVVDPELRVRGVVGLRVADASVMPEVPTGNTTAPVVMIGEKAADLVLGRSMPPERGDPSA
ncbi:GMC family oxidoreductase [Streptoalloteichus hindustanus]|uniref:Choline dehydrogenase n=1 Tax=Streptoalloteichus hindustanus TaxID=2017 RepID=A0A1M5FDP5_STRHI|nr:GMC family oxidoreductase N-terminal domain-containing protein [Streptoalloteichus hindustanus]SHF89670.1 choline dehydrogenase [Streptoalloteichus hindustanus]